MGLMSFIQGLSLDRHQRVRYFEHLPLHVYYKELPYQTPGLQMTHFFGLVSVINLRSINLACGPSSALT